MPEFYFCERKVKGNVVLILTQFLKRVSIVVASEERALVANAHFTCPAVHRQLLLLVSAAQILLLSGTARNRIVYLDIGTYLLETLHLHGNVLEPAAVDQLRDVQRGAAVRTLAPALRQPLGDARIAAELRTVRTQVRLAKLLHADEAAEDIAKRLRRGKRREEWFIKQLHKKCGVPFNRSSALL